jgi:hypothetical protein
MPDREKVATTNDHFEKATENTGATRDGRFEASTLSYGFGMRPPSFGLRVLVI